MRVNLLFLLFFCGVALPCRADILDDADQIYQERLDPLKAKMALELYQKAIVDYPGSVEALWKASRTAWWVGDQSGTRHEKINFFNLGISYAQEALKKSSDCVEAHFWLGGNYGSFGEEKGVLKSLFLVKPIRQAMEEVNRIDDRFEGGGGYRVLGVLDYKVPGFAGGNRKRAQEMLEKAYAIDPEDPYTLFYLAEYYLTIGDKDQTLKWLDALDALTLPDDDPQKPDAVVVKTKGIDLRKRVRLK